MTRYHHCPAYALVLNVNDSDDPALVVSALEMLEDMANIINSQTVHAARIDDRYANRLSSTLFDIDTTTRSTVL